MKLRRTMLAASALIAFVASSALPAQSTGNGPKVVHTAKGPTGYSVTFRYANPTAKQVQIRGEWAFARPSALPRIAGTAEHPIVEGQALTPAQWQPGDFPLQTPNATAANFPVAVMVKGRDGAWTYTIPLPSGTFSYSFVVDCNQTDAAKCSRIADPANPPWNGPEDRIGTSQVYVPSDPAFNTVDYSWQAPARVKGKLTRETYASPGHVAPKDVNNLVVYTPPNYDPKRAKPYPTLYLSHGGGGDEMSWTTQGVAQNILDNLIASGQVEPIVVVMPNGSGYAQSTFNEAYDRDLIDRMIPFVEGRYHVSHAARDRAFSGLSMGGMLTNSFLIKYPESFGYFGTMSAGLPPEIKQLTPSQIAGLKGKSVWFGGGWQDVIHIAGFGNTHTGPARQVGIMAKSGVPMTTTFINGGHEWYVWRILLQDFLTRAAFLPVPYADAP